MKKRVITTISILLVFFIIILFNLNTITRTYIYLFKKNTSIKHYNRNGQYDGDIIEYLNGRVFCTSAYKNGLREGWTKQYFTNGQLKNKKNFKDDKANGIEKEFYNSGVLNYVAHWYNGVRVASEYHYSPNGKLLNYDCFDINNDTDVNRANIICYAGYNETGKISKLIGGVLGFNIYSKVKPNNSNIILTANRVYSNLDDLYINVATPPSLTSQVEININDVKYIDLKVKANTVIAPHVFISGGKFLVVIVGKFINSNKMVVKSDTLMASVNVVR
jgi:hypothetical protein